MGYDLASVLWDVLDGYNFYKNFKTTAIGNDSRGLPQPVNRSLFFDEEDSEDEQFFNHSDSSRQSQLTGNPNWLTSAKNFMLVLGHDIKETLIVSANSIGFFFRKACKHNSRLVTWLMLLMVIPLMIAGLLEVGIKMSVYGLNECSESKDNKGTNETISEQSNSTLEGIQPFPNSSISENGSSDSENLSDSMKCNSGCVASIAKDDVENCRKETIALKKKLHDSEVAWAKQSEVNIRSIEYLREQVSSLEKSIRGSEGLYEEGTQTRNDKLETWKKSISSLVGETQESISAFKDNVNRQFEQFAEKTSSIETIESKIADISIEFSDLKSNLNKKISDLQNHVEGSAEVSSRLTIENVREIVREESEQKAGEANWIIGVSDHSPTHKDSFFSLPFLGSVDRSPEVTVMKRNCWPMHGSQGFIQYELADKIVVSMLTIEHLHKSRRLIMGSVLKNFRVEGSPDGGKTWLNLGSHIYDAEGPAVQHFNIAQTSEPLKTIKLFILSNYGELYTCLYGVAVSGKRST